MTQQHPITPPLELVMQWSNASPIQGNDENWAYELFIADQASKWAADQELEACCEWMAEETPEPYINALRFARRPNPPGLKKQALSALENLNGECLLEGFECPEKVATIRRALEQLDD
jgi:hypothetical protein